MYLGCLLAVSGCFTEEMGALYMLFTVTSNFSFIDGIYTGNIWVFYGYFTFYMYFTGYFGTTHLKQYQNVSKYQNVHQSKNVYQYQKHIASPYQRLSQDHLLVMMSQDKSATQSKDRFHLRFQLKSAPQ